MNDPKIIELMKMYSFYNDIIDNDKSKILEEFNKKLHHENRFFNDNHPLFTHIKNKFEYHTITLNQDEWLFRARKVEDNDYDNFTKEGYFEEDFYGYNKKDSFTPPMKKISANRANSDGIPCLYTAKDVKTAIAEVRPFLGDTISVANILPVHDLKLFDLSFDVNIHDINIANIPPSDIWFLGIVFAFSIPYEKTSKNEYLLTQCISEYIRLSGFDGIQYSSSLNNNGINIALFNCKNEDDGGKYDICEPISSHCCTVKSIDYCFEFY